MERIFLHSDALSDHQYFAVQRNVMHRTRNKMKILCIKEFVGKPFLYLGAFQSFHTTFSCTAAREDQSWRRWITGEEKVAREMNMMPPTEKRENALLTPTPPEAFSTWHDLAGHWLRNPAGRTIEAEALARRLDALQRWRGLSPETSRAFKP